MHTTCSHAFMLDAKVHSYSIINMYYALLVVAQPICRDDQKTRWWLQSMYQRLHANNFTVQQMLVFTSTYRIAYTGCPSILEQYQCVEIAAEKVYARRAHSTALYHFTQPSLHKQSEYVCANQHVSATCIGMVV